MNFNTKIILDRQLNKFVEPQCSGIEFLDDENVIFEPSHFSESRLESILNDYITA